MCERDVCDRDVCVCVCVCEGHLLPPSEITAKDADKGCVGSPATATVPYPSPSPAANVNEN